MALSGSGKPHVLQVFQPAVAGVPVYVADLSIGLIQRGWAVSVALPEATSVTERLEATSATLVPLRMVRRPSVGADLAAIARLTDFVRDSDVDIIHGHSTKAGQLVAVVSKRTGIPSVFTPHGWSFEMRLPMPARLTCALVEGVAARFMHRHVITVAGWERDVAERWRVLPRGRRSSVVLSSVGESPPAAGREAARRRLGIPLTETVAAWVGRNSRQKRPEDLVPLARRLAQDGVTVVAMGVGLAGTVVAREFGHAGGLLLDGEARVQDLYAAADLLVQTSEWEGLPLVILEAMMAGLPVVAYDVGGVAEAVVHGETGFLVEPRDVAGAARWCAAVGGDDDLRIRLGRAGRERGRLRFGRERMLDEIERIYLRAELAGGSEAR